MTSEEIARRRLHNQRLWGPPFATPGDVVGSMAALQAQEFAIARWSIGQRTSKVTESDVDRAFAAGRFVRTHILRPTWHFVAAEDIRWMLRISGPRVHSLNAHYYRKLEVDDLFTKTDPVLAEALAGGHHLTRKELATELERSGFDLNGMRLAYVIMHAELEAIVCSGAPRGKQQTYARLDERVPSTKDIDREAALAELTRRYFTTRGPATIKDLARWSSLTQADCKAGLAMVGSVLTNEVADGRTYWFAERSYPKISEPRVDLVQIYDEYVMSYSESRDVLGPPSVEPNTLDQNGYLHAILLGGCLIGRWRSVRKAKSMSMETSLYLTLKPAERKALKEALERYEAFVGLAVD